MNVLHIKYGPFDKVETSIEHKILKECVVYVEMMLMRIRKEIVFPSTSIAWVFSHDIWGIHQIVTHKHTHTLPHPSSADAFQSGIQTVELQFIYSLILRSMSSYFILFLV